MNNQLQIFKNENFGQVRMAEINGKPYFVGKDIAKSLGYKNYRDAISRHCKGVVKHDDFKEGGQRIALITEGDMYRLITNSDLPQAEKFEVWVFDEVLPQIRKTGQYQVDGYISKLCTEIETLKKTINEATDYYKIQPKTVRKYTDYIKKRLKITHANEEFEQVKVMVFARLGIEKWCDIPTNRTDIYDLIERCMKIVKKERPYEQKSFFDEAIS
ncbi:TPA: Bro-N domain-containing protein [Clostridium perfringens]